jgi:hypothetical protein
MEGVELTKVKYTHSGVHGETPLNTDLGINNEKQDSKIRTVCRSTYWREEGKWRR